MKKLLASLPLLIALGNTACTPTLFKGMESEGTQNINKADLYPVKLNAGENLVYSLELSVHDNVVNCLLMVEPDEANNSMKIVCTSVFGTTILDASISEKGMLIYDCADDLKHKKVLKLLERDLKILFLKDMKEPIVGKVYRQYYVNDLSAIATDTILMSSGYRIKNDRGRSRDYKTNEVEQKLECIASEGKITKSSMQFTYKEGSFIPNTIKIEHPVLKLSMFMELQDTQEQ